MPHIPEREGRHQVQRWHIKEQHYKMAAEWLEHLGLAVLASVVFQKIVSGASLSDPVIVVGSLSTLIVYIGAAILMLLS